MSLPQITVLISGRGSNLQSLIQSAQHYHINAVISNKPDAAGLQIAENAGIKTTAFKRKPKVMLHTDKQFTKPSISSTLISLHWLVLWKLSTQHLSNSGRDGS